MARTQLPHSSERQSILGTTDKSAARPGKSRFRVYVRPVYRRKDQYESNETTVGDVALPVSGVKVPALAGGTELLRRKGRTDISLSHDTGV